MKHVDGSGNTELGHGLHFSLALMLTHRGVKVGPDSSQSKFMKVLTSERLIVRYVSQIKSRYYLQQENSAGRTPYLRWSHIRYPAAQLHT